MKQVSKHNAHQPCVVLTYKPSKEVQDIFIGQSNFDQHFIWTTWQDALITISIQCSTLVHCPNEVVLPRPY